MHSGPSWKDLKKLEKVEKRHMLRVYVVYIDRRFRGVGPACPIPRNREIGFVSSSFSSRAVRASEAKLCGRMQTVILIAGPPGS